MNPQSVGPTPSAQRKVFTAIWSEELRLALLQNAPQAGYHLSLVGADSRTVTAAVNQGIDACLEACYVPARGDRFGFTPASRVGSSATGSRLEGELSPASLVTLVRRLLESEEANAASLATGICETLGLELS